ncbi:hypothetical protein ACEPAG_3256 [Sanghuangporus baumii]
MANIWSTVKNHLNFFRVHLLFFIFSPLIFSVIFYAANGRDHISYIDSLYNSVSATTVCGLATVDLSTLTGFQQALLFIQSSLGNPVVISWIMCYIRRRYFAKRFENIVAAQIAKRKANMERGSGGGSERRSVGAGLSQMFSMHEHLSPVLERSSEERSMCSAEEKEAKKKRFGIFTKKTLKKLRPDMIRRMDDAPKPVGPNGWISEEPVVAPAHRPRAASVTVAELQERDSVHAPLPPRTMTITDTEPTGVTSGPGAPILARTGTLPRTPTLPNGATTTTRTGVPLGHTLTVEFKTPDHDLRGRKMSRDRRPSVLANAASQQSGSPAASRRYSVAGDIVHDDRDYAPPGAVPLARRYTTYQSHRSFRESVRDRSSKHRGYGGFPYPTALLLRLFKFFFPNLERKLVRTVTIPNMQTISTYPNTTTDRSARQVNYVTFNAIVGRNSQFHLLTEENLEELGGVEYRALTALLWIVACYHFVLQLLAFVIIAPYMSIPRWRSDFNPPNLHRHIPSAWFSAFQVVSAYTNTGLSLVDQSMIPFQTAYPLIFVMVILILAGNTAYLALYYVSNALDWFVASRSKFASWCITKCIPINSRLNETLHFLLDHPRRCFIYLFPSQQTWFLLSVVIILNATDYFFFLVLDIGNATMEAIPLGVRFAIGLLQSVAVRSAGFATVSLGNLAPAVQTLFVMMMYVSVYPIAMSVRSTNVYEEKSLGIFDDDNEDNEPNWEGPGSAVWGRYLAWHARRQLAFDMWWIGLALFLLCIIERSKIQDEENYRWFTIFTLMFELISAYAGVGLSLGVAYGNFSFSGALTPLSKLIIIAVMIRGRHRGLPVAIDRAVMLPFEFKKAVGYPEDNEITTATEPDGQKSERILEETEPGAQPGQESEGLDQEKRIVDSPVEGTSIATPRSSHDSHSSQTLPQ